eukprot:scaffold14048_cov25-Phaeocystis_antarctica.AAC.2
MRAIVLSPLGAASPRRRQGSGRGAAGSHVRQRGEGGELRGQAAAQAVVVNPPERSTSGG